MTEEKFLVIGEVFIDTHLDLVNNNYPLVRLGGIFHSARGFSSIGANYALAYYAPDYLEEEINHWSSFLQAKESYRIGIIKNSPNVMLINESKEAGNQGYYNILKDQAEYTNTKDIQDVIDIVKPTDILIFPGRYNSIELLKKLNDFSGKIHIDTHYDSESLINNITREIETLIFSTSSIFFNKYCDGNVKLLVDYFPQNRIKKFIIKENRGGSYCYLPEEKITYEADSYYVKTMHSVGVGDVYNSIFISPLFKNDFNKKIKLASLCAAKYSETMNYDKYKENIKLICENFEEISDLGGVRLTWTDRKKINIYLAAPDFPEINTELLDKLNDCLLYHNFTPRLPIRENGLAMKTLDNQEKIKMYYKDLALLEECNLLIAVLLYNDPGTLVELGMFKQSGKPTIIYDPYGCCDNIFVKYTPDYLCKTITDVIEATYLCMGRSSYGNI